MTSRYRRIDDCKIKVEECLRELGYATNALNTNKVSNKQCVVTYSNVSLDILTQESYNFEVEIEINLTIDNSNEVPYTIFEIVENVTKFVEASNVRWCSGFCFKHCSTNFMGEGCDITLTAYYQLEVDWMSPDYLD